MTATAKRPVVAAVDTSVAALSAARWAAGEALRRECSLTLLHTCLFEPAHDPVDDDAELLLERTYRWLQQAESVAQEAAPEIEIRSQVRLGLAADLLIESSAEAGLMVLGSHGLGGLRGALIGSVALRVAAAAACPVVVVHGRTVAGGPVVVGVDRSAGSEQALRFALDAAAVRAAPVVVVHAWQQHVFGAGAGFAARAARERRDLERRIAGWAAKYPELTIEPRAVPDRNPAQALTRAAAGTQLIVVGSRWRGPVAGGVLGSTGNTLLGIADCPVAVVH